MGKANTPSREKNYNILGIFNLVNKMVEGSSLRLYLVLTPTFRKVANILEKCSFMKVIGLTVKKMDKEDTTMTKIKHIFIVDHGLMMRDMGLKEIIKVLYMNILVNGSMGRCQVKEY